MTTILMSLVIVFSSPAFAIETVPSVDLSRYLGKWYEIASIPAWFQKKCVKNTTAEYKLLDFGKIDVINSCTKKDGTVSVANGIARVVNKNTNAELKVSFVPLVNHFGWFAGQYKVLVLDPDYQYVVVGEDKLSFGWILSRAPSLSIDILAQLEKEIRRLGYDSCKFLISKQENGSFLESGVPLCQVVKQ